MESFIAEVDLMPLSDIELILKDQLELYTENEIRVLQSAYEKKLREPTKGNQQPSWEEVCEQEGQEDSGEENKVDISSTELDAILRAKSICVTTTDISKPYEIISPIIYNTTNRGIFSSLYKRLLKKYSTSPYEELLIVPDLSPQKNRDGISLLSLFDFSMGFEGSVGQGNFDSAFYMSLAEIKLRASQLGGNAIVGLKVDFDLDTTNFGCFYLQMYGTVVKSLDNI
jgi:hypothetical protein